MRYRLATYRECKAHREWNTTCPDCGRKGKFSPYIDTVTMQPVDDKRCGRCNRLSNCGYHLPPREVARTEDFVSRRSRERRENSDSVNYTSHRSHEAHRSCIAERSQLPSGVYTRRSRQQGRSDLPFREIAFPLRPANTFCEICEKQKGEICETKANKQEAEEFYDKMHRAMQQSQPWGHHLGTWLRTKFPREQVDAALKRYHVGGTPDGATLWWQIDEQGRVHTGKAMQYNSLTGHRVKEQGFPVNWAHRMRLYGEPTDLVVPQCLFGLHLIDTRSVYDNDNENRYPLRTTCSLAGPPSHRALCSPRSARLGIQPTLQGPRYAPLKRDSAESTKYGTNQKELSPFKGRSEAFRGLAKCQAVPSEGSAELCTTEADRERRNEETERRGYDKSTSSLGLQAATPPLVRLVESEKTDLILSLLCPDKVWLATGGKQNFKEQMLMPLLGYEVEVYPDADALTDWYARAVEMNRTHGTRLHIPTWYYDLMNHDEARRAGLDLADVLLR